MSTSEQKVYDAGRESSILEDIKKGTKTIECRLNRGKFSKYEPGDIVYLREDFYENGEIIKSISRQVKVEVQKIEKFTSFETMFETIGFEKAIPRAKSISDAVMQCRQFYTEEEEKHFGVLAIYFKVLEIR